MEMEEQHIIETNLSDLIPEVTALRNEGFRLVAITATRTGTRNELCYSFDRHYRVRTYRVILSQRDTLPSITGIYPSAFVYENELQDIFGIAITGSKVISRDSRPRKWITYPFEFGEVQGNPDEKKSSSGLFKFTITNGDTLCQNR